MYKAVSLRVIIARGSFLKEHKYVDTDYARCPSVQMFRDFVQLKRKGQGKYNFAKNESCGPPYSLLYIQELESL